MTQHATTTSEKPYPEVDSSPDFPALETATLRYWKENATFKTSVSGRAASVNGASNEFIFFDGPPFANGLPHYGHLLTGYVKDLFARYQTMRGKKVERRFGWDCHGLPAEMGAEKDLGISGRQAIMYYGINKFNDYCRTSVMKYTQEWESYVNRQARWVDFGNDYKTMDVSYMESVLWAFKQLHEKGLLYEAYRVMPYSWAAETPLSNFETRLDNSYRARDDKAITVGFILKEIPEQIKHQCKNFGIIIEKAYLLAWTTTPWTLPSNLALAINPTINYEFFDDKHGNIFIASAEWIAKHRGVKEFAEKYRFCPEGNSIPLAQDQLLGKEYFPLFPYFKNHPNAFRILDGSDFVSSTDGTGVVHIAPGFGEDDQRVSEVNNIELVCPVDHAGRFTAEIVDLLDLQLRGLNVIEENVAQFKFGEANERITNWLKQHGHLIKQEQISHNYPHCWRTDKPLIYKAVPSWYVEVTKFRDRMVELNQQINWIPDHIRDGLFGKWLENARDWSISRNRFWGTPIPVWKSTNPHNKKLYVFGSIAELEQFFGTKVPDLHRPFIDDLTCPDPEDPKYVLKRVEDVFDCWFESGSMPFAQAHYPFENKEWFEHHFPADFIVEYVAQTRGWFYTLMVLATALFDKPPFKNCICHGVVLDDKGQKLSKRLGNYVDPTLLFEQYGSDALRWFMMSSPVMRGSELYIDKEGKFIRDVVRLAIKPIWNAYTFFCLYANADGAMATYSLTSHDTMDCYILIKCKETVKSIQDALDRYDTPAATEAVSHFFDILNNWYIRRNKDRFWTEEKTDNKQDAYNTLFTVLHIMCRATAPLLPLTLETIYQGITRSTESVHLQNYPDMSTLADDDTLLQNMNLARDICNTALSIRNKNNIRVRQPLHAISIVTDRDDLKQLFASTEWSYFLTLINEEVNVQSFSYDASGLTTTAEYKLQIHFPVLGKRLPDKIKQIIPAAKKGSWKNLPDGRIEVAGEKLEKTEFSIMLEPKADIKERAHPLSSNDALVILDTHITPELEADGYARDLVRLIQQARKEAGLRMTDRINLKLRVSERLSVALHTHKDRIAKQVLASSLEEADMMGCTFISNETIENEEVSIGFAA